jgi:branched-chain amino acid aminotransferase
LEAPPDADRVAAFLEGATNLSASAKGCLRLFAVDGRLHVRLDPPPPPLALPVAVCLSHAVTRFAASPLNRFKTLSYLENRRLQQEAERQGCFEALALNERGRLTDGGRTTLLVRVRGRWLTPPVEDGALPGIARGLLLEAEVVEEASLHPEELTAADGAALVNALRGVIPVGRGIGLAAWEREPPGIDGLRRILA